MLTAFASSIGIIGIALILSLSTGFKTKIDEYQSDALSEMPIMITQSSMNVDSETMEEQQGKMRDMVTGKLKYVDSDEVYLYDSSESEIVHENKFTSEYIDYIELIAGEYPTENTDLVLVVDNENKVDYNVLKNLGYDTDDVKSIKFDDIVGTELKLITNNDYYTKTPMNTYMPGTDYKAMYNSADSTTLKVSGIVRLKKDVTMGVLAQGIVYSDELVQKVIDNSINSDIVKAQEEVNYNIMTMEEFDESSKKQFLSYLGGDETPFMIMIYPKDFETKDKVTDYLDDFNNGKDEEDVVMYTDLASTISDMTGSIMDAITLVLVAFAGISLVVSLIMISIITYTSVLERTKEIGILKALGARKKDITRVFDAETCILGVFSGVLGIVIAWLCTFPINNIIYNMTDLEGVANLQPLHAIILVIISTILTMLGGHIPAKMASKKDAVEALRSE